MRYSCTLELALPRDKVIALFDDPDNLAKWQEGLVSFEPLSGTPGEPGAKSRLTYKMGKRTVVMTETVTERNLPETFSGTYEADGVWNGVANRFTALDGDRTRWDMDCEFQGKGLMRVMMVLFPGMFRKQTAKMMQSFKDFAESE